MSTESIVICTGAYTEHRSVLASPRWLRRYVQNRWLKLVAGIGVLTILLNCLAISFGRIQPHPSAASAIGLGLCDGVPCYKHLVPGKTSWAATTGRNIDARDGQSSLYRPVLSPSADGMWLDTIRIQMPPDAHVAVGDIVQIYGAPCRVDLSIYGNWSSIRSSIMLHYPHLDALVSTNLPYLSPDMPVSHVFLHSSVDDLSSLAHPCRLAVLNTVEASSSMRRPWYGFTSIHHYLVP